MNKDIRYTYFIFDRSKIFVILKGKVEISDEEKINERDNYFL
jgi:hypothetical protein